MKYPAFLLLAFLLLSCNDGKIRELNGQIADLNQQLDDCKNGADRLLTRAINYFENNELDSSKTQLKKLELNHPETLEAQKGDSILKLIIAIEKEEFAKDQAERDRIEKNRERALAEATRNMSKNYDDFKGITWYQDKTSPRYTNYNGFFAYIGKPDTGGPFLRLKIQYAADEWLFIEKYIIKADDRTYEITEQQYGEIETDNGSGGIWEWLDRQVGEKEYEIIEAVANANEVKIRFVGRQYHKDRTITNQQKQALKNVLAVYHSL